VAIGVDRQLAILDHFILLLADVGYGRCRTAAPSSSALVVRAHDNKPVHAR
jgi:hypothetical protein